MRGCRYAVHLASPTGCPWNIVTGDGGVHRAFVVTRLFEIQSFLVTSVHVVALDQVAEETPNLRQFCWESQNQA